MFPIVSIFNLISVGQADSKKLTQFFDWLFGTSNLSNNIFRYFSICISIFKQGYCVAFGVSILTNHISMVVCSCSKIQMIWIYAFRIVTFVQNTKALIKKSLVKLIGQPMSKLHGLAFQDANHAISARIFSSDPNPTVLFHFTWSWEQDLTKKSIFQRLGGFHGYL